MSALVGAILLAWALGLVAPAAAEGAAVAESIPVAMASILAQQEITGRVEEVSGRRVMIRIESDLLPRPGDPVSLYDEVPGVGPAEVTGEWVVWNVGPAGQVLANGSPDATKPREGQTARIASDRPRTMAQLEAERALFEAAAAGDVDGIEAALAAGVPVDVRGVAGSTALMHAAQAGHRGAVRMLLDAGADPDAEGLAGDTPLVHAAGGDGVDLVPVLVAAGADVDHRLDGPWGREIDRGASILFAVVNGVQEDVAGSAGPAGVRALLEAGADPDLGRRDGATPLLAAAGNDSPLTIRLLVRAGADVEARVDGSASGPLAAFAGMTPLLLAATTGGVDATRALLEAGADPDATDVRGRDALTLAREHGHDEVAALLRDPGRTRPGSHRQITRDIERAAVGHDVEQVRTLLAAGAQEPVPEMQVLRGVVYAVPAEGRAVLDVEGPLLPRPGDPVEIRNPHVADIGPPMVAVGRVSAVEDGRVAVEIERVGDEPVWPTLLAEVRSADPVPRTPPPPPEEDRGRAGLRCHVVHPRELEDRGERETAVAAGAALEPWPWRRWTGDSPARAAGLGGGTVILAVDGEPVRLPYDPCRRIARARHGEVLELLVLRPAGERETVRLRVITLAGLRGEHRQQ